MRLHGELFARIEKNFEPCLLMYAGIGNTVFSIGAIPICPAARPCELAELLAVGTLRRHVREALIASADGD